MSALNTTGAAPPRAALHDGGSAPPGAHTADAAGVGGAFRALRRRAVHAMVTSSSLPNPATSNGTHA